jgi:hypothetical protein
VPRSPSAIHVLAAVAAVVTACAAPDPQSLPAAVRAAGDAIDSTRLHADVAYLASDALLGRDTPSPGLDSATAYVVRRLTALGLEPSGDSGSFLQRYAVREIALDTAASYVEAGGQRFRMGADFIVSLFADTGTWTLPLAYVQHGIRAKAKGIDPYAGLALEGRAIVADGPGVLPPGETFESIGEMFVDWDLPQAAAESAGARAVLMINTARTIAGWTRPATVERSRMVRALAPAVPSFWEFARFPVLWVTPRLGAALLRLATTTGDRGAPRLLAGTVTIHLAAREVRTLRPANVVARVPGTDRRSPREAVVLAAHLDGAVGRGGADGDTIYNAADDNASGSAALLAVAEAMMRTPRPRRDVLFVWDSGEESGLWGSRFFAAHPPVPLAQVVAYHNVDMIGRSKAPGTEVPGEEELAGPDEIQLAGPRAQSTALDSLIERTNREYLGIGLDHRFDAATHEYFYPRTDAAPLVERGVLTVNWMNGEHGDYHGVGDEVQKLDLARMTRVTRTIFATAWMLAAVRERPAIDKPLPPSLQRVP